MCEIISKMCYNITHMEVNCMATITTRVDDNVKDEFLVFCDRIGLTASALFNMFAKTCVREQKIPFEINALHYEARMANDILSNAHEKLKDVSYMSDEEVADEIMKDRREKFSYASTKNNA